MPVPRFHPRQTDRPTLPQRLRTLWHRTELDHRLAQGVEPATSDELELRAEQLLSRRSELAAYVDEVLDRAHRPVAFTAAQAWLLLTDGSSPLYLDGGVSLRHAVRSARLVGPISAS